MSSIGALSGIRVIEAATLAAAPLAATLMAEFGAEVIKVEHPSGGDPLRDWGPQREGVGLMWKSVARNKKSITLDLHHVEGQDLFCKLVQRSDVLLVNFRPGTLARWNVGYETLSQLNPGLVMLQVSGFGEGGPYSRRPGFGTLAEAMSGFADVVGQADGPPTLPPLMLADGVTALNAVYAVMFALYHRDVHGSPGQFIDISLVEPLMRLLEHMYIEYDQLGRVPTRNGSRWDVTSPRNIYRTRDDKWVALSGSSPSVVVRMFRAIGRPDLVDQPGYSDAQARLKNADEIDKLVGGWIRQRRLSEVLKVFESEQVAVAPVYNVTDMLQDPHFKARESFVRLVDTELGSMLIQAPVPRFSGTPGVVNHLGPPLGSSNRQVFIDMLGLDEARYEQLGQMGVI